MNCEWIQTNTALYLYDELADDQRHELERHLERCADCRRELEAAREFKMLMSSVRRTEPSPNLLAASRMRLQEALESQEQAGGWRRFTFDFGGWMQQLKFSPALALMLLIFGFSGGVFTAWKALPTGGTNMAGVESQQALSESNIAAIRAVVPDASDPGKVEIKYDTLQTQSTRGSVDDPQIKQLLLYASRNNLNSGVRMDSINVLTKQGDDDRVREALMYALRYDKNPGVRLKSLEGLKPYVKQDLRVRDAVLEALMGDSNPGVRTEAINILRASRADSSVRDALYTLANQNENEYLKIESKRLLSTLPEID